MGIVVALVIVVVVFAGALMVNKLVMQREQKELTRQRIYDGHMEGAGVSLDNDALFGAAGGEKSNLAQNAESAMRRLGIDTKQADSKLGRRLLHAGIGSPNAIAYYRGFQFFVSPVLVALALFLILNVIPGIEDTANKLIFIIFSFMMLVGGLFGPHLYVENMTQKRRKKLLHGFPDTLDLLLVCVESGLALDAALNRVTGELDRVHPDITAELNRTRIELSLLNNRSQALQNFAERTNLIPFRFLVAALIQSERFGTSLTETLRVMADEYRTKRMLTAEEKAARLPALMTIPLIFCLLPSFMLIVLGPAVISFMESNVFG